MSKDPHRRDVVWSREIIHWRVEAPHFVAGFTTVGDRVTEAAPILGWTRGKTRAELRGEFERRKLKPVGTRTREWEFELDCGHKARLGGLERPVPSVRCPTCSSEPDQPALPL